MAEPATSIAATAAFGAGTALLSALGLEGQPLFWSLAGATIGISFASATSKPRAAIVFGCVVLVCSLFGVWLALRYTAGEQVSRNTFACGLGVVFHPLLNAIVTKGPEIVDDLRRKWFGGSNA